MLGALLAAEARGLSTRSWLRDFGGVGFCGGLTTFSTFSVEVVLLSRDGRIATAAIYAGLSVAAACAGLFLGAAALGRPRAVGATPREAP